MKIPKGFVVLFLILGALALQSEAQAAGNCLRRDAKGTNLTDDAISGKVKEVLNQNGLTPGQKVKIDVFTEGHVVHLSGKVESVGQKNEAECLAESVEGVQRVKSALQAESEPPRILSYRNR